MQAESPRADQSSTSIVEQGARVRHELVVKEGKSDQAAAAHSGNAKKNGRGGG